MKNDQSQVSNSEYFKRLERVFEVGAWGMVVFVFLISFFLPLSSDQKRLVWMILGGMSLFSFVYYRLLSPHIQSKEKFYITDVGYVIFISYLLHVMDRMWYLFLFLYFLPVIGASLALTLRDSFIVTGLASFFIILQSSLPPYHIGEKNVEILFGMTQLVALFFITLFGRSVAREVALEQKKRQKIVNLLESQKEFIADISHELRTPLTILSGNIQLLLRKIRRKEIRTVIETIGREVIRLSRLVENLLLLSRGEEAMKDLDRSEVELNDLLLEVYTQTKPSASGVTMKLVHEDLAPVIGDRDRLKQLFLNLVDNAIKYTDPGGTVRLGLYNDEAWVRVVVSDTGIGIEKEHLPYLFERFNKPLGGKRQKRGTGLGLSIARMITLAHGGKITVESIVGKGTTFTVFFPKPE
ncbi:MAG TPA: HAMP domain-containing sensor histidine kinase [Patescibacteria group bacterium]|nr:HAMP domain-containing sensor histidine kinase [Patescibacteria group bacterium]